MSTIRLPFVRFYPSAGGETDREHMRIDGYVDLTPEHIAQILGDLPGRFAAMEANTLQRLASIEEHVRALEHHTHLICTGDKDDENAWCQTNEPMTTKPFLCPHCGKECKTWFDRTMDEQGRMATRCEHCGCDVGEDAKPLPPQEHTTKQQDAKPAPTGEIAEPIKGDYVLATKYEDGEAWDWWGLGWLDRIDNGRFMVVDSEGKQTRGNGYRRCRKISKECGNWLWSQRAELERAGAKLWDMVASFNNKTQPTDAAKPDADEAAATMVESLRGNERHTAANMVERQAAEIAALRRENSELGAQLSAARLNGDWERGQKDKAQAELAASKTIGQECVAGLNDLMDKLRADLAAMTERAERLECEKAACMGERDEARIVLGAEQDAHDMTKGELASERDISQQARTESAQWKERAEKAERELTAAVDPVCEPRVQPQGKSAV